MLEFFEKNLINWQLCRGISSQVTPEIRVFARFISQKTVFDSFCSIHHPSKKQTTIKKAGQSIKSPILTKSCYDLWLPCLLSSWSQEVSPWERLKWSQTLWWYSIGVMKAKESITIWIKDKESWHSMANWQWLWNQHFGGRIKQRSQSNHWIIPMSLLQ